MKNPNHPLLLLVLFSCLIGSSLIFSLPAKSQTRDRLCETSFRILGNSPTNLIDILDGPHGRSELLTTLPSGTEVLIINPGGRFVTQEIMMPGGKTGWVSPRYLLPSPAGATQFNGTMRVRNMPGGEAVTIGMLISGRFIEDVPDGAIVTYNGNFGFQHDVTTSTGVRGLISISYLVCN